MKNQNKILYNRQQNKLKILIVGSGGIGCQLVKNLYKSVHEITIMDYDTISQTNLNRQFCFRKQDIGKYKVDVLSQYFIKLNPNFSIKTQNGNMYQYDSLYCEQFDILISALDNYQARVYLNQMAIDNNLPMIDAGTSGYNGQVQYFIRYLSQCRMCRPVLGQETNYAVCSLRDKPQRNIHCVHFALHLYRQIGNIHQKLHNTKQLQNQLKYSSSQNSQNGQWNSLLKIFNKNIKQYTPSQLHYTVLQLHNTLFYDNLINNNLQGIYLIQYKQNYDINQIIKINKQKQQNKVQNIINYIQLNYPQQLLTSKQLPIQWYSYLFIQCIQQILMSPKFEQYDKDCFVASLLIYSIVNLRIKNFMNIQHSRLKSMNYYQCKDMSGKIIPAIASTNSIAAAIQTLCISKILVSPQQRPKYITIKSFTDHKVQTLLSQKPKQNCQNCSYLYNYVQLYVDMSNTTWGELQLFLVDNFDESLQYRDMRCQQFILIRNSGMRPFITNKSKLLNFNKNLVRQSKLNMSKITIKYIPTAQLSYQNINGQKIQYYSIWKIVLIDNKQTKILIKRGLKKQQYKYNIQKALKQIKQASWYIFNKRSTQNNQISIIHQLPVEKQTKNNTN